MNQCENHRRRLNLASEVGGQGVNETIACVDRSYAKRCHIRIDRCDKIWNLLPPLHNTDYNRGRERREYAAISSHYADGSQSAGMITPQMIHNENAWPAKRKNASSSSSVMVGTVGRRWCEHGFFQYSPCVFTSIRDFETIKRLHFPNRIWRINSRISVVDCIIQFLRLLRLIQPLLMTRFPPFPTTKLQPCWAPGRADNMLVFWLTKSVVRIPLDTPVFSPGHRYRYLWEWGGIVDILGFQYNDTGLGCVLKTPQRHRVEMRLEWNGSYNLVTGDVRQLDLKYDNN